jgi:hypothetical protein
MGQKLIACDREQSFLMPPDVREWLPENHLAWFVIDAVGETDFDAFYTAYRRDGRSRPAYDPVMMVALLLYAYARGTRIVDRGIPVLIPPDAKSRKGTRPGWEGGLYAFMRRVLASERGGELYGQRQAIIEPVFANTKFNRGIDRFRRRGRAAVRAEWRLITATHNLLKLHRHATAAA